MTTAKKSAGAADKGYDAMSMMTPDAFKQSYEKFAEGVSTFADFNKHSIEAMMASANAWSKGVEKLASENSAYLKSSYEDAVATAKSAAGAKSVQEAFDIQSEFARESVEKNLSQANKVADLWIETTKNTVAPLTERYGELIEKIQAYRP